MSFTSAQGQAKAVRLLSGLLSRGRLPPALLLAGPEGVGKALLAHDFAKALLCPAGQPAEPCGLCPDCQAVDRRLHPDVKAVNQGYQTALNEGEASRGATLRVDTILHLRRDMELQPLRGRWKVAVIEDAHTLELESSNALLKALEEPPPRTLWILTSAQRERLPGTVRSRCALIPCSPLPSQLVAEILSRAGVPAERARRLAALSEGSASRALRLAQDPGVPESMIETPLAPLNAADALPREAPLARERAEQALYALSQDVRLRHLDGELSFSRAERPLRRLERLRRCLRSNADPRTVLLLACLEAQGLRQR
ncbi:MAG: DNA polymerase III subunit [Elusimicrobia bacterium]|nr:DNA polymerase III subunit [Elusimicrobiota bacterium]MDE2236708.1 DNA polymerase III subunit [Elusimicrobiota bacterium]MDE2426460.1 DNA polymerase III subunit [Elusimicrobiota bacterium]